MLLENQLLLGFLVGEGRFYAVKIYISSVHDVHNAFECQ